jgi:hypothetical protein
MGLQKASKMFNIPRATVKDLGMASVCTMSVVLKYFSQKTEQVRKLLLMVPRGVLRQT